MADLHPQLQQDCIVIGKLELCHLLLMKDANYPWFILVPDREGISEIFELDEADQQLLLVESSRLGQFLVEHFKADKLNVAALGNVVPQLHVHHIVRYKNDISWPKPVWGQAPAQPYVQEKIDEIKELFLSLLT
jgi:diadenosine tetraphosphate (Ap4A) HIT family hydrolase